MPNKKGLYTAIFILLSIITSFANQPIVDSIQNYSSKEIIKKATLLVQKMELETAQQLLEESIVNTSQKTNEHDWAVMNYLLADCYYFNHNHEKAKLIYHNIEKSFENLNDTLYLLRTRGSLGVLYCYENDNVKTLDYNIKIIATINQIKNPTPDIIEQKKNALSNMINLYNNTNEFEKSLQIAPEALALAAQLNDSINLGSIHNSIGVAYKRMKQLDKALSEYNKARDIYLKLNDQFRYSFILNNMGGLYVEIHQPDSALHSYTLALQGFEKEEFDEGIAHAKLGMASIYNQLGHTHQARELYKSTIEITQRNHFNELLLQAFTELSNLEYQNNNYKEAFEIQKEYDSLNDSLFNIEKEIEYKKLKTQYEVSLMENELSNLKNESFLYESRIKVKIKQIQAASTIIIFLVILVYIVYIFYKQKYKANITLLKKNNQIAQQNIQLKKMNDDIECINDQLQRSRHQLILSNNSKSRFFSVLAHDLKNPFHNIMGYSNLLSSQFNNLNNNEIKDYAHSIYNSSVALNSLLENLLEWSRTQTNNIKFNPTFVDINQTVNNVLALLQPNASEKNITIEKNIAEGLQITADQAMLETIFRNLINNGIKFTPKGGKIDISACISPLHFEATISDNGVGINKKEISKIFRIDSKLKTAGTNNEKGTGLGLVICSEFIKYHSGEIWVKSEPGNGSSFHFTIPNNIPKTKEMS